MIISRLATMQWQAYQQLDVLVEVCHRPEEREHLALLYAVRDLCGWAWSRWQMEMQCREPGQPEPDTPDVPNLTLIQCQLVATLYRAQQH